MSGAGRLPPRASWGVLGPSLCRAARPAPGCGPDPSGRGLGSGGCPVLSAQAPSPRLPSGRTRPVLARGLWDVSSVPGLHPPKPVAILCIVTTKCASDMATCPPGVTLPPTENHCPSPRPPSGWEAPLRPWRPDRHPGSLLLARPSRLHSLQGPECPRNRQSRQGLSFPWGPKGLREAECHVG